MRKKKENRLTTNYQEGGENDNFAILSNWGEKNECRYKLQKMLSCISNKKNF